MSNYLPLFIDMTNRRVTVFGGGAVAARRIGVLLRFGAVVTLVSPEISGETEQLLKEYEPGQIRYHRRSYRTGELQGEPEFVFACTDDETVNDAIYRECRHREIPVSVASDQSKCDFYFPAVIEQEDLIIGISSGGKDHRHVREAAASLRRQFPEDGHSQPEEERSDKNLQFKGAESSRKQQEEAAGKERP